MSKENKNYREVKLPECCFNCKHEYLRSYCVIGDERIKGNGVCDEWEKESELDVLD